MRNPAGMVLLLVGLAVPVWLPAHEGHAHKLMGTITAVHAEANHLEIKTTDGDAADFVVDDKTKYLKGKKPSSLQDIKPGLRVVVTFHEEGQKKIATEVRLSDGPEQDPEGHPHSHP